MLVFNFKLSDLFLAIHSLIFVLVAVFDLGIDILVVRFKFLVSPLKSIDSLGRIISEVLEMASHVFLFHSLSLELSFQLNKLGNCLVIVKLILYTSFGEVLELTIIDSMVDNNECVSKVDLYLIFHCSFRMRKAIVC